tara:strand:+ start:519 stop:794 length:276 start_codon:yes stop_codon:yes gene_type:complete
VAAAYDIVCADNDGAVIDERSKSLIVGAAVNVNEGAVYVNAADPGAVGTVGDVYVDDKDDEIVTSIAVNPGIADGDATDGGDGIDALFNCN